MKPILKEDLLKYRFASNICANAAGTDAAFVQHRMVKSGYRSDVYHIDVATGAVRPLTKDGFSSAPVWDGDDALLVHGIRYLPGVIHAVGSQLLRLLAGELHVPGYGGKRLRLLRIIFHAFRYNGFEIIRLSLRICLSK